MIQRLHTTLDSSNSLMTKVEDVDCMIDGDDKCAYPEMTYTAHSKKKKSVLGIF